LGIERVGFLIGCKVSYSPRCLWIMISDLRTLQERVTEAGYAFISADYRLMPPSTAHDIIDDIKDAFRFIREDLNSQLSAAMYSAGCRSASCYLVDPNAIAVAGSSAGGQCALYAAMHVSPKPKAMVLMYSMGGDYLVRVHVTCTATQYLCTPQDTTISDREDGAVLQRSRDA